MDPYKVDVSRTEESTFTVDHYSEEDLENLREAVFDFVSSLNQIMPSLLEAFRKAVFDFVDSLNQAIPFLLEAFKSAGVVDTLKRMGEIMAQLKEEESIRQKGLELDLVSNRVIELSRRPGRTGKKNMNRIRKELRKYGKHLQSQNE